MVEMEQETTALFEQLRTLVGGSRDQGLLIQEELGKLLPKAEEEEEEAEEINEGAETAEVAEVTEALTKMKLRLVSCSSLGYFGSFSRVNISGVSLQRTSIIGLI